jgi:L-cysteine/cystine lyase
MATETDVQTSWQDDSARIDDWAKLAAIRAELPVMQRYVYFNAGTNGPLPRRTHDVLVAQAERELVDGRISADAFARMMQGRNDLRAQVAALLGCDPLEVALTHNTTEGMNIALMGLDWRPGDEVVTATTEHPGGLNPVYVIHQRYGVRIRMTEIGLRDRDSLEELRRALTPRTKAVVLSHVVWSTGMVLPLRELAAMAHSVGALLICDAAQAAGMVPSNVYDLGVDAYACSGQKWLCGPDGTGALFIRADRMPDIHLSYAGYFAVRHGMSDFEGNFVPSVGAVRYECATLYPAGLRALGESLRWIAEDVGRDWAYQRIAMLGAACYDALAQLDGVTMHTPRDHMAGLVHFTLDGVAPADLTTRLAARGILIRHTPSPLANRVATGFYNTEAEITQLVESVRAIRDEARTAR